MVHSVLLRVGSSVMSKQQGWKHATQIRPAFNDWRVGSDYFAMLEP